LLLHYLTRGQTRTASQLGEQLLRLAHAHPDSALLLLAHYQLGLVLLTWGEPASAQIQYMQALAIYTPQAHRALALHYGIDFGVASHTLLALALWQLGFPDQAVQHSQAACTLAQ
jgi:tetratricopeptide (TPR) repeat protein